MPLPNIGGTLVYHYDAETLVLADGADVQLWADQSGNGRDLNAQNLDWPDYVASAINGKPGVRFTGGRNIHNFFTGVQPCTTFYVFAVAPNDVGSQVYVTPNISPFFVKWTQAGRWIFGTNDTNLIEFTDAALSGQPVLFTGVYRQTGAKLRANGVQRVTGNLAAVTTPGGAEFGFSANGATETFTLCEMVQYDGELDTADIVTIETYLDGKWFTAVPSAPTNPTAVAQGQTSILVGWDDVANETGYRVEQSADGSTGWVDVSGNLAADAVSYLDTGLTCGTQYFYRVIAFNGGGDSSPSTVVDATTSACGGAGGRKVLPSAQIRMRSR